VPTRNDRDKDRAADGHRAHGPAGHSAHAHSSREPAGAHDQTKHEGKAPRRELEQRVEELLSEVETLKAEVKATQDKYLRVLADFDNHRKRVAREYEERTRCANEDLIRRLLEVVDNMERAVGASADSTDVESLRKGLELTYLGLKEALTREGLCPIECLGGKFDPNYHEAIMAIEKEGSQADSVIEEVQKGYMLNGRVLRPSKVVVSK
jgi:molecular chaperone GrpE